MKSDYLDLQINYFTTSRILYDLRLERLFETESTKKVNLDHQIEELEKEVEKLLKELEEC